MQISFNLKSPGEKKSPIRVVITHRGKVYRKATGISVLSSSWKKSSQKSSDASINKALSIIRAGLENELGENPSERAILGAIERIKDGKWTELPKSDSMGFYEYFLAYVNDPGITERSRDTLRTRYNKVRDLMGDDVLWTDIGEGWLLELKRKMEEDGKTKSYTNALLTTVKTLISRAGKLGYCEPIYIKSRFTPPESFSIYLTEQEIESLYNLELSRTTAKARDVFLIQYYTCSRFSDALKMSKDMIKDGMISFYQKKTDGRVVIPASPKLITILDRNGGKAPSINHSQMNQELKVICLMAGINDEIAVPKVVYQKMGREPGTPVYKWELVSSHTARRSAATNLYKAGLSSREVMFLTGHKTESSLMRYIRITQEETAEKMKGIEFFK